MGKIQWRTLQLWFAQPVPRPCGLRARRPLRPDAASHIDARQCTTPTLCSILDNVLLTCIHKRYHLLCLLWPHTCKTATNQRENELCTKSIGCTMLAAAVRLLFWAINSAWYLLSTGFLLTLCVLVALVLLGAGRHYLLEHAHRDAGNAEVRQATQPIRLHAISLSQFRVAVWPPGEYS